MGTTTGVSKGIWQDDGTGWGSVEVCLRSEPADANTESCEDLGSQDMGQTISKGPSAVGLGRYCPWASLYLSLEAGQ